MWIAILGGVAAGVLATLFMVLRRERGYRMLFSDTHLKSLGECLEAARVALFEDGAGAHPGPAPDGARTTFEGVSVHWERLPRHVALTLATKAPVVPAAARFLLAFAVELCAEQPPIAALQLDKRRFALVWERAAVDGMRPLLTVDDATLVGLRAAAADAMRTLPVSQAQLAAYR